MEKEKIESGWYDQFKEDAEEHNYEEFFLAGMRFFTLMSLCLALFLFIVSILVHTFELILF